MHAGEAGERKSSQPSISAMDAEKGSRFMRPGAIAPVTSASAGDRNLVAFLLTRNAATYFVF